MRHTYAQIHNKQGHSESRVIDTPCIIQAHSEPRVIDLAKYTTGLQRVTCHRFGQIHQEPVS